jgi:23S rRNA pseudouridine2605 synthase
MRINKFVALASGMSRRAADKAITEGRVMVNGSLPKIGQELSLTDEVELDKQPLAAPEMPQTIVLNKPTGYVVSRQGQGSKTIYDLLPPELHHLKPIGRLDKDSSGLLLLTNDGQLAQELTHPKYQKTKIYEVEIDKPLSRQGFEQITKTGVDIGDYVSRFQLKQLAISNQKLAGPPVPNCQFLITITEGKNRQIRRTFAALGYTVIALHRSKFGEFQLPQDLKSGTFRLLSGA